MFAIFTHKGDGVRVNDAVGAGERRRASRREIFRDIMSIAGQEWPDIALPSRAAIPYLTEPWYC